MSASLTRILQRVRRDGCHWDGWQLVRRGASSTEQYRTPFAFHVQAGIWILERSEEEGMRVGGR